MHSFRRRHPLPRPRLRPRVLRVPLLHRGGQGRGGQGQQELGRAHRRRQGRQRQRARLQKGLMRVECHLHEVRKLICFKGLVRSHHCGGQRPVPGAVQRESGRRRPERDGKCSDQIQVSIEICYSDRRTGRVEANRVHSFVIPDCGLPVNILWFRGR